MRRARTRAAVLAMMLVAAPQLMSCGGEEPLLLSPEGTIGREIANDNGCAACHGRNGQGRTAPSWQGIYMTEIEIEGGGTVLVDDDYLRRSITDPQAEIVQGWTLKMPKNDLSDEQIESIVTYIKELT